MEKKKKKNKKKTYFNGWEKEEKSVVDLKKNDFSVPLCFWLSAHYSVKSKKKKKEKKKDNTELQFKIFFMTLQCIFCPPQSDFCVKRKKLRGIS